VARRFRRRLPRRASLPPFRTCRPTSSAPAPDREAKRLARYDCDKDGAVSRDEHLRSRQRAFAKLDGDGDRKLSFEEYTVKTAAKFGTADEFVTTAVKRKPKAP
jgi:hypothetical protein